MLELGMQKLLPYLVITLLFVASLFFWHKPSLDYRFDENLVRDYLRSQDIEDPKELIKDRIYLSDSDLYIASGYLYVKGEDPTKFDFQVPAFIKYLFGFSTLIFGNPFYVQMAFGLVLLFLTYFLGQKLFQNKFVSLGGTLLLLFDPVFSSMQEEALLDLGLAVFALSFVILMSFYPKRYILIGVVLGLFAASKFWSVAGIFMVLVFAYKFFVRREKTEIKKILVIFGVGLLTFSLVYIVAFIKAGGRFNIFLYILQVTKYMLSHNSAGNVGGTTLLFLTGYFFPWWQVGVFRSDLWTILWPAGMLASIWLAIKTKTKDIRFFFYMLPVAYLLLTSTQVPFARYFLPILPFTYLAFANLLIGLIGKKSKISM